MTEEKKLKSSNINSLRRRAKSALARKAAGAPDISLLSTEGVEELIHSLQIHQIELELQNDELRRAHLEVEESRDRYRDLYDFAPVGYLTLDCDGLIVKANLTAARTLGTDRRKLIMRPLSSFLCEEEADTYQLYFERLLESQARHTCEVRLPKDDGTSIHVRLEGMAVHEGQGKSGQCRMVITDITELKKTEQELQTTLQRFYAILSSLYAGVLLVTEDGRIEFANQAFCDLFELDVLPANLHGFTSDQMIQKIKDIYTQPAEAVARTREIVAQQRPVRGEEIGIRGGRTYLKDFIPIRINGKPYGRLWHHQDITERKKAEQALFASEERYRGVFENAAVGIDVVDSNGYFLHVNSSLAEMLGYTEDELLNMTIFDVSHPDDTEVSRIELAKTVNGKIKSSRFEKRFIRKNGEVLWADISLSPGRVPDGGHPAMVGVVADITDRKRAEEGLRKREAELRAFHARFQAFMDNGPIIAFMRDDQGRYVYVNRVFLNNNKYSSAQVLGKTAEEIFPEEMARKVTKEDRNVVESNSTIATIESLIDHTGYQREWWLFRFPVKDADGRTYVGGVGLDLTERKRVQKALEVSEERFRCIYENIPLMVHSADRFGVIQNVNKKWLSHMGYDREEVIGRTLYDLVIKDPAAGWDAWRSQLWTAGALSNAQGQWVKKDGSMIDIVLDSIIIDDPVLGSVSLTAVHDITDLKRAEDQIKKSLAEKEVLLHEINHRVKNNLQVMSSLLRLQSRQVSQKNYSNVLKEAQNRLHTMALIHEKLFQSRSIAHIDVEAYLKRLVAHLSYLYGVKSSRIKTIIDAQGLQLKVDKADPIGLIANELISNCFKYAFPEGRQGTVSVSFSLESNEFQFMVSDNGVGLREDLDTSDVQTLGLQLVNTLVKQLHGIMIVKRSGGTEFLISFPVSTS